MENSSTTKSVLILSDSHAHTELDFLEDLEVVPDQIWHAGDIGDLLVTDKLAAIAPTKAVYGNIDGMEIRRCFPEYECFRSGGLKVLMIHIGGRPGRYSPQATKLIQSLKPDIFICGHSHICRVERDKRFGMLYINPGAIGISGFHKFRTCILLRIEKGKPSSIRVLEYPRSAKIPKN
nr:metallophosphoesterase family protein [Saprospiraceae bacterium]